MAKKISRRHMLRLTAATVGGVTAWAGWAHATPTGNPGLYRAAAGSQKTQYDRPYWAPTYSGGPVTSSPWLKPGVSHPWGEHQMLCLLPRHLLTSPWLKPGASRRTW